MDEVGAPRRIVGGCQLGWRIGKFQAPAGCHMLIGGDDGKGLMRWQVEYLMSCDYEDH